MLMQAFRMRGIYPDGARFFSEDALCWPRGEDFDLPEVEGLQFGDPNALTNASLDAIGDTLNDYENRLEDRKRSYLEAAQPEATGRRARYRAIKVMGTPARAWSRKPKRTPTLAARSATIRLARLPVKRKLPARVESSARP